MLLRHNADVCYVAEVYLLAHAGQRWRSKRCRRVVDGGLAVLGACGVAAAAGIVVAVAAVVVVVVRRHGRWYLLGLWCGGDGRGVLV
jgi:hypothetical protein